jgi:hypothetical protein
MSDDEHTPTASGGHSGRSLRLEVPGYDGRPGKHPLSYLQLGAPPHGSPLLETGDDLLEAIELGHHTERFFRDDDRVHHGDTNPAAVYLRDDGATRVTATQNPTAFVTARTAELLTRGGIREHTDGNRLTTTRGDRIEVIGGNHKLVVLGRRWERRNDDGHFDEHGWEPAYVESSGGVSMERSNTGTDEEVHYRYTGTPERWQIVTETIHGNAIDVYEGNRHETYCCRELIETIGGEGAIPTTSGEPQDQDPARWLVPEGETLTFVNSTIVEDVRARSVSVTKQVYAEGSGTGTVVEEEWVGDKTETTRVTGTWTTNYQGDVVTDQKGSVTAPVPTFDKRVLATGKLTSQEFFGLKFELVVGALRTWNSGKGFRLQLGAFAEAELAAKVEAWINCFRFGFSLARKTQIEFGVAAEVTVGLDLQVKTLKDKMALSSQRLALAKLGSKVDHTKIHCAEVSNAVTKFWL